LCYSTEEPSKVRKALKNVIGESLQIVSKKALGYYKDPIYIMECFSNNEKIVEKVFNKIIISLGARAEHLIKSSVEMSSKEHGKIHIRLDKQEAYLGRIREGEHDAIKIEFSFRGNLEELISRLSEMT